MLVMSASAQLCGLVCSSGCGVWVPPDATVIERDSGNAVMTRKFSVIGCGGYVATTGTDASPPNSWPMPLASTTTSLPSSIDHSLRNARRLGMSPTPAFCGSTRNITLPPLAM
jgi:hypothetical protein